MKAVNFVILLLSMLNIFLTSCNTTEPEDTGYHNKILFTARSQGDGKYQLFMINPDGSNLKQITSGELGHGNGRWSPDAQKILCNIEGESTADYYKLAMINSDGSNMKYFSWGITPCWSPDGSKITFYYLPWAELGILSSFIYTINADGTDEKQITSDSSEMVSSPCWSKQGDKIYFASNRHDVTYHNTSELFYMNSDGSNVTRLTYTINGKSYSPSISPSGSRIVYMSNMNGAKNASIYICNIDGSDVKLVVTPPEDEIYNYPRWSPDENNIVFTEVWNNGKEREKLAIYRVGVNGKNLIKLVDDAGSPDWSR